MIVQSPTKPTATSPNITEQVVEKLNELPVEKQQQVLDFVEFIIKKHQPVKSIWEKIDEITQDVPDEVWDNLPADGAEKLYLSVW
ncbi:MAG: hypothetical protein SXA11_08430 [Cyanobacteriota bacterium]|nr:hypothetical protein [Cyanobacteriota bacterium]